MRSRETCALWLFGPESSHFTRLWEHSQMTLPARGWWEVEGYLGLIVTKCDPHHTFAKGILPKIMTGVGEEVLKMVPK